MKNNFDDQFDRNLNRTMKTVHRTFAAVMTVWLLGVLMSLAVIGGLIFIACHFISKLW